MNLGAFGDWWNSYIGSWWDLADWGSVPAWVGSILTSVSVFLAINILRVDRKSKKLAPADALATWQIFSYMGSTIANPIWTMKAHAYNTGDSPIPFAMIGARQLTPDYEIRLFKERGNNGIETVEPKEHLQIDLTYDFNPNLKNFYIRFTDAHGREWIRRVKSRKYMSVKRFQRWEKGPLLARVKKRRDDRATAKVHSQRRKRPKIGAGK